MIGAAVKVMKIATGEVEEDIEKPGAGKSQAAVELGRKGGRARAAKMSAKRRKEIARKAAAARWRALYRDTPPKGVSRSLLVRAVAYQLQVKRFGGLKRATARHLQKIANGTAGADSVNVKVTAELQPGARLVREWNGSTHIVDVVDGGFTWNGEFYGSLSVIARRITGARWSGPRFFGLTSGSAS